ncbi:MAG: DUF3822 family protein [Flavobacteriales bacterium]|nr:DUF3822 family protein [Flavobacteriales bacterium]
MGLTHLSIIISGSKILFSVHQDESLLNQSEFTFSNEEQQKEELENHIVKHSFLSRGYDEYLLSFSSNKSTLVPNNIFAESSAKAIHKLCFGPLTEHNYVDYNRIAEVGVVNVFEIPSWIKRFFILKYPRVNIQHEGSYIVRKMLDKNSFKLKATISLHSNYFQFAIVKHSKLEFFSFFDFQNDEDILYHLLFVLQQKEFTDEKGTIEFIGSSEGNAELIQKLEKNILRIKELNQIKIDKTELYIQKAQILCV